MSPSAPRNRTSTTASYAPSACGAGDRCVRQLEPAATTTAIAKNLRKLISAHRGQEVALPTESRRRAMKAHWPITGKCASVLSPMRMNGLYWARTCESSDSTPRLFVITLAPTTLEGNGVRLEPLTPAHEEALAAAAADG